MSGSIQKLIVDHSIWPLGALTFAGLICAADNCYSVAHRESPSDAAKHVINGTMPRTLAEAEMMSLRTDGFLVIDGFIPNDILKQARKDADVLRYFKAFKKTGQHSLEVRSDEVVWLAERGEGVEGTAESGLLSVLRRLRSIASELEMAGFSKPLGGFERNDASEGYVLKLGVPLDLQLARYPSTHEPRIIASARDTKADDTPRYRAHRDGVVAPAMSLPTLMNPDIAAREITVIIYLSDWQCRGTPDPLVDDGELVLYLGAELDDDSGETSQTMVRVAPVGGRLVAFDSKTILHEVKPHHRAGCDRLALTSWIGGDHSKFGFLRA